MPIQLNQVVADDPNPETGLPYSVKPIQVGEKEIEVMYQCPNGTGCLISKETIPIFVNNSHQSLVQTLDGIGIKVIGALTITSARKNGAESSINPYAVVDIKPKSWVMEWLGRNTTTVLTFKSGHKVEVLSPYRPLETRINDLKKSMLGLS